MSNREVVRRAREVLGEHQVGNGSVGSVGVREGPRDPFSRTGTTWAASGTYTKKTGRGSSGRFGIFFFFFTD
jgi:hypothetical protein